MMVCKFGISVGRVPWFHGRCTMIGVLPVLGHKALNRKEFPPRIEKIFNWLRDEQIFAALSELLVCLNF